jgi:hypothetical protein
LQAITNAGVLRTGLQANSFQITVIDSNDSVNIVPSVTESSQRPGNYYFDIPSTFFIANGPGDYNVSIEINTQLGNAGSPHIKMCSSDILQISQFDFDTLSGSIWNATAANHNVSGTTGYLLNQAAGTSTIVSASVDVNQIASGVWDALGSNHTIPGSMGSFQNTLPTISSSVSFIEGIENGTWIVSGSQMIFYTSGTLNEIARFNLQDINGIAIDPATQNPFRRVRV